MIIKEYIKRFEKYGLGMFVHFGIYSVLGKGEWALSQTGISHGEYEKLTERFNPDPDWADELVATAKAAGCRYITLTTRHHDGFSLYDTCGLNDYDAPHALSGRDLVREFVDACNRAQIVPFFYHTLLDWREKSFEENFPEYLVYLRKSVELLCKNYGRIGGLWFDGSWSKKDADWEEDALYALIRKYQPEAMIINNTGLSERGKLGHIELDSTTFERGKPEPINLADSPKYVAREMCQVFGDHWGYAALDYNFKSLADIIRDFCGCRRYNSNFLINVGPMASGKLRPLDAAMLRTMGEWINRFKEAFDGTSPASIPTSKESDFVLRRENVCYLFCDGLPRDGSSDVVIAAENGVIFEETLTLPERVRSVKWLESGKDVRFVQIGDKLKLTLEPQPYGQSVVVRIAKIELE